MVMAFKPLSLVSAYEYALYMESAVEMQQKRWRNNSKVPLTTFVFPKAYYDKVPSAATKPNPGNATTKGTLIDQRRALELCFKCGDKYYPRHQCKFKIQMLQGDEGSRVEVEGELLHQEETEDIQVEAFVSMHATSSATHTSTMKFKGVIGSKPIFALIDSGSTHSFINPAVLQDHTCHIQNTHPMVVMVANEERMVTNSKCDSLLFSIHGFEFKHELRLLPVKGYDMILGLDWLSQFGPMTVDWNKKWV
jgi:RNase P/RNase MRP subunit p29